MSMERVRNYYKVPVKRGARIRFTDGEGKIFFGTIFSTIGSYLKVRIDGMHNVENREYWILHPTLNVEYI